MRETGGIAGCGRGTQGPSGQTEGLATIGALPTGEGSPLGTAEGISREV